MRNLQKDLELCEKALRTCQKIGRKYEVTVCEIIKKLTVKCPYDYGEGCPLGVNNDCDKDDRHLCWQQILRTKARESRD